MFSRPLPSCCSTDTSLQEYFHSMALSAQTLRPGPYSLPQPGLSRLSSSCSTVPYNSPAFSNAHLQQQQQHYSINYATSPPSHAAGLSFQNSVLLPGGSQCSMLPPSSTTSIQLPGSPVSIFTLFSSSCLFLCMDSHFSLNLQRKCSIFPFNLLKFHCMSDACLQEKKGVHYTSASSITITGICCSSFNSWTT